MLTRIKIQGLFNVYDYDIDLTNSDKTTVKFITQFYTKSGMQSA